MSVTPIRYGGDAQPFSQPDRREKPRQAGYFQRYASSNH
jgi:hypothetical protein